MANGKLTATTNASYATSDNTKLNISSTDMTSSAVWLDPYEYQVLPYEASPEFREFMIWLCGYTDRESPPSEKEWKKLKKKVQKTAADFVAYRESVDKDEFERKQQHPYKVVYTSS